MHELENKIRTANSQNRHALIPFLTAGFPDREGFWKAISDLDEAGADIIEIGVPFSDPVADGPVVEEASRRSLANGMSLREILAELKKRKGEIGAGIVLMGYMNPFLQYGLERFAENARKAGVEGVIVPDLPFDEDRSMREALARRGIALIPLVGPNTPPERMELYAKDAEAYVYVVSVMGITGERSRVADHVAQLIDRARKIFKIPVALGFGLKSAEQLEILPEASRPDAAVFGSALLTHLDNGREVRKFMDNWKK